MGTRNKNETEQDNEQFNNTDEAIGFSGNGYTEDKEQTTNEQTELEPTSEQKTKTKGKRGRPKGSRNKTTSSIFLETETDINDTVNDAVEGSVKAVKNSDVYKKRKSGKYYSDKQAQETSDFIITMVNTFAVQLTGEPDASMNVVEQGLINLSLPQYLQTLEISTVEKGSKILFPIIGLLGVSLYGLRVANIIIDKRNQKDIVRDIEAEEISNSRIDNMEGYDTSVPEQEKMRPDVVDWAKTKSPFKANNLGL